MNSLLRQLRNTRCKSLVPALLKRSYSLYEPDYLDSLRPKYPVYETLTIRFKGYDFPILENYQRFVNAVADSLDIDVVDSWATPSQQMTIQKFKPSSAIIDAEYKLTVYERNLQIQNVPSMTFPQLLRIIQAALPEGVELNVDEHSTVDDEKRYVPDKDLLELKAQLDDLGGPTRKK